MSEYRMLINGTLVYGVTDYQVLNPATEEAVASCPKASEEQINEAVAAAKAAFPAWAAQSLADRRERLERFADVFDAHADELSRLLTEEQGKPLSEARGEVQASAYYTREFAKLDMPVEIRGVPGTNREIRLVRYPLGVAACIVAWNFPLAILVMKVAPALLAGNTVVIKPSPTTPLSTLRLLEMSKDIFPPGVINVVCDNNDMGHLLTGHPDVAKVSFTGSTATGKKVMASAAATVKRLTLELGGNDAAILLSDFDPSSSAKPLFDRAFGNAGQICLAVKRIYVHESQYEATCSEFARIANELIVDDGLKQGTQMGPVQNRMQFEKVKGFIDVAHRDGKVIAGGLMDRKGYFVAPTVVRDIADGSPLVDEEQFGPVIPLIRFTDLDDVIDKANSSPLGLGASVWSADKAKALEVAARLEAGQVWINDHNDTHFDVPFGGAKQSGTGVEFAREGLLEYTQLRAIHVA